MIILLNKKRRDRSMLNMQIALRNRMRGKKWLNKQTGLITIDVDTHVCLHYFVFN